MLCVVQHYVSAVLKTSYTSTLSITPNKSAECYYFFHNTPFHPQIFSYFHSHLPLVNHEMFISRVLFVFIFIIPQYCCWSFRSFICCSCLILVSSSKSTFLPHVSMHCTNHAFIIIVIVICILQIMSGS